MADALSQHRPLALFAKIEHPSGYVYFWTGLGTIDWDGHTWTGIGNFGGVAPIKYTSNLGIQEVVFSVDGVDATIAGTLNDNVRNKNGTVWLACIGERGNVIADPYQLLSAELDYQQLSVNEEGVASISIIGRTGFYTLERAIDEVWSTEDQQTTFPTDVGMDLISELQNKDIIWTPT